MGLSSLQQGQTRTGRFKLLIVRKEPRAIAVRALKGMTCRILHLSGYSDSRYHFELIYMIMR